MAKAFSIRDFLDNVQEPQSDVFEKVSVYDIGSNPKNEYTISEIEKIKDSIYALGGVQQNVVLVKCPEGADHKYLALDGHRRLAASRELVEEGYSEFEFVPAVVKGQIDADTEDAMLIMMNSTQRNKTDWEKVMEHMRLKEIIPKLKKRQGLDGRTRDIESELLGVSQTQVNIYNTIGTSLNAELMEMFKIGQIGISLAYEAARQEPDIQKQLAEMAYSNDRISEEDIKSLSDRRVIEGQLIIQEGPKENVSESDTFEKAQSQSVYIPKKQEECGWDQEESRQTITAAVDENVSESNTFEETQDESVPTAEENKVDINQTKPDRGYDLMLIDRLIERYKEYLELAIPEKLEYQIDKYSCLIDALELLREKVCNERG